MPALFAAALILASPVAINTKNDAIQAIKSNNCQTILDLTNNFTIAFYSNITTNQGAFGIVIPKTPEGALILDKNNAQREAIRIYQEYHSEFNKFYQQCRNHKFQMLLQAIEEAIYDR